MHPSTTPTNNNRKANVYLKVQFKAKLIYFELFV